MFWSCGASAQGFGKQEARWVVDHKCDHHEIENLQPRFLFPGTIGNIPLFYYLTCELSGLSPELTSPPSVDFFPPHHWSWNDVASRQWCNYLSWKVRSRVVGWCFRWYLSRYRRWKQWIRGNSDWLGIEGGRVFCSARHDHFGRILRFLGGKHRLDIQWLGSGRCKGLN